MTYIDYINQFWKTSLNVEFSSNEAYLYFYLLSECNRRGWENPFECPNRRIILSIGVSEPTIIDCRNRLQQKGLIEFESGKRNTKSPVYYLNNLSKPLSKTLSNNLSKLLSKKANYIKDIDIKSIDNTPPIPPEGVDGDPCIDSLKNEILELKNMMQERDSIIESMQRRRKPKSEKPKWKEAYEVYLDDLRGEYIKAIHDSEWIARQEVFNPGVDIQKSIEKTCVNYWATEAGWKKKKRGQITDIDWRSTFANAISKSTNRVYKDSFKKSNDKYEQKRIDSEQRKLNTMAAIQHCNEEAERRRVELEAKGII